MFWNVLICTIRIPMDTELPQQKMRPSNDWSERTGCTSGCRGCGTKCPLFLWLLLFIFLFFLCYILVSYKGLCYDFEILHKVISHKRRGSFLGFSPVRVRASCDCAHAFIRTEQLLLIELNYKTLVYPPPQTYAVKKISLATMGGRAEGQGLFPMRVRASRTARVN